MNGKVIDGIFYESLREFEKKGGGDPATFCDRWENAMERVFTQDELNLAFAQILREREKDRENAQLAAEWIDRQLNIKEICVTYRNPKYIGNFDIKPTSTQYVLEAEIGGFGNYGYFEKLDNAQWAKPSNELIQAYLKDRNRSGKFYDVETPYGKFKLTHYCYRNVK